MMMRRALTLLALGGLALAGCGTTHAMTASFPAQWPAPAPLPKLSASPSMGRGTGIAVAVSPWTWPGVAETSGTPTTAEALTQLTQAALRVQGFEVVDEGSARYRLACTIGDLSYTIHQGYPSQRHYVARATCQLLRTEDQQFLWQRDLEERVDETLYVNTYSRLPAAHERAFIHECLPALMERLTESLLIFFRDELPLRTELLESTSGASHSDTPAQQYRK